MEQEINQHHSHQYKDILVEQVEHMLYLMLVPTILMVVVAAAVRVVRVEMLVFPETLLLPLAELVVMDLQYQHLLLR